MRLYFPYATDTGWTVAYANHRGEVVAVMECRTFDAAHREAELMTARSLEQAGVLRQEGNRYLRKYLERAGA